MEKKLTRKLKLIEDSKDLRPSSRLTNQDDELLTAADEDKSI